MAFIRPQHVKIARALRAMDIEFLVRSNCYFGGGTAIVLMNGEYRLSLDVDFLCADVDGYRELRSAMTARGASSIFGPGVETLREFKADQYGIRGIVSLDGEPTKFEIVREGRIPLEGAISAELGVPVLSLESQFAEKLLANADRGLDRSIAFRDAIDLGRLVLANGDIPSAAIDIAEKAYGRDVVKRLRQVLDQLGDDSHVELVATKLQMDGEAVAAAARALCEAAAVSWPDAGFTCESLPRPGG